MEAQVRGGDGRDGDLSVRWCLILLRVVSTVEKRAIESWHWLCGE